MDKTKILFLAANPLNEKRIASDKEIRTIREKLLPYRDNLELVTILDTHPQDWLRELNIHRPRAVHFIGHGTSGGMLLHVGANDMAQGVSPQALKGVFQALKSDICLVTLSACYSEQAAQIIAEEIGCVIGTDNAIHDEQAITFFEAFYDALGIGHSVQKAFDQGKAALPLNNLTGDHNIKLEVRSGVDASKVWLIPQSEKPTAISIFCCYDPADTKFCADLKIHLTGMRRQGLIKDIDDQNLLAGDTTQETIRQKLEEAQIILLIVSPKFLYSDDIYEIQLQQALERHKRGEARVIPIIVEPTDGWKNEWFGKLAELPQDHRPVSAWPRRDDALYSIVQGIRQVVEKMTNDSQ